MVLYVYYENGEVKRIDSLDYYASTLNVTEEEVDKRVEITNAKYKKGVWVKTTIEGGTETEKIIRFLDKKHSSPGTYDIEQAVASCERTLEDVSCDLGDISSQLFDIKEMIEELKGEKREEDLF